MFNVNDYILSIYDSKYIFLNQVLNENEVMQIKDLECIDDFGDGEIFSLDTIGPKHIKCPKILLKFLSPDN